MVPVDILILSYNRLKYLIKTVDCINRRTEYPYRIIVADNASDNNMPDKLKSMLDEKMINVLVENQSNLFMDGWHYGLKHIKSDLFCITDPDIEVPALKPCWLTQMVNCFNIFPNLVRLGTCLSDDNIAPCWNKFETKFLTFKTGKFFSRNPSLKYSTPDTTLQMIRKDIFEKIDGFKAQTLDFKLLKSLSNHGVCAVHQDIICRHLGWDEYKDYPEYLKYKNKNIKPYRETGLIK
ncbi:glycosyltransferase family 2 protein [bacterium]|nr:glycosyltransferase family 2 protein [bacterium]